MIKLLSTRNSVVAVAAVAATIAASGLAFAYWSTTGTGTAAATAGSATPVTAGTLTVGTGTLFPTGTAQASVSINNPNAYSVFVNNLIVTSTVASPSSVSGTSTRTGITPACSTSNSGVSLTAGTYPIAALVAPGNNQVVVTTGTPKPFAMDINSADNCQGMQFNFTTAAVTVN